MRETAGSLSFAVVSLVLVTGCAASRSPTRWRRWVFAHGVRLPAPLLSQLDPDGPAQAAGVRVGDRLLALGDQALDDWQQVVEAVRARPGQRVALRSDAQRSRSFVLSI